MEGKTEEQLLQEFNEKFPGLLKDLEETGKSIRQQSPTKEENTYASVLRQACMGLSRSQIIAMLNERFNTALNQMESVLKIFCDKFGEDSEFTRREIERTMSTVFYDHLANRTKYKAMREALVQKTSILYERTSEEYRKLGPKFSSSPIGRICSSDPRDGEMEKKSSRTVKPKEPKEKKEKKVKVPSKEKQLEMLRRFGVDVDNLTPEHKLMYKNTFKEQGIDLVCFD